MKNVASLNTDLPDTYAMKTQQLYTNSARAVESTLVDKVGRSMLFHGPKALNPQEQFEDKAFPTMPEGVKQAPKTPDPALLFQTRKKITDIKEEPEPSWGDKGAPRSMTPQGVHNPMNNPPTSHIRQKPIHLRRRNPKDPKHPSPVEKTVIKASQRPPVNLKKNTTTPATPDAARRPTSIVEAERMANQMIRDGQFSRFGDNFAIRA